MAGGLGGTVQQEEARPMRQPPPGTTRSEKALLLIGCQGQRGGKTGAGMPNWQRLDLYNNEIAEVHADIWEYNTAMVQLSLRHNKITEVHPDTLQPQESVDFCSCHTI